MKTRKVLRALLVTTSLSTALCGMENSIHTSVPEFVIMDPARSFKKEVCTSMISGGLEGLGKDWSAVGEMAGKAYRGDWASLAGGGMHYLMDLFNNQLLSRYTLIEDSNGEFNPESLRPFLRAFREKVAQIYFKSGDYALNEKTGERYFIHQSGTPFKKCAEACIPTSVPMRSLLISICNADLFNNWLGEKLDELAISSFLKIYQKVSGNSFKESVGQTTVVILNALMKDYENHGSSAELTKDFETTHPLWAYLRPRLHNLAREAFSSLLLETSCSVTDFVVDEGLKKMSENSIASRLAWSGSVALGGISSACAWGVGGFVTPFVTPVLGGMLGLKLSRENLVFSSMSLGILAGLALPTGVLPAVGFLGSVTVAATTGLATFASVSSFGGHALKSAAKTSKAEVHNQLKLFVDYYTYSLINLTYDEHVLYNLNPSPTEEEKIMYHLDYARREELQSQSFVGSLCKEFIDTNGALVQNFILPTFNGVKYGAGKMFEFITYCLSPFSKDTTAAEILAKIELKEDSSLFAGTALGSEKAWREFVVRTAGQEAISDKDKILKENLIKFRSFKVKERYLAQLYNYMNWLSKDDLNEFSAYVSAMKENAEAEEKRIKNIYNVVQNAGKRMAEIYKEATKEKALDEKQIRLIQDSANKLWLTKTMSHLELLVEALMHHDFIPSDFNVEGIEPVIDAEYLENTLNDYMEKRDEVYLREGKNQLRFKALRESSLTEGLEDADVVDFLRKIDAFGLKNLPQEIQSLFQNIEINDGKDQFVFLSPSENLKHHELQLIKAKYEALLGQQLTVEYTNLFVGTFKQKIENIAQEILQSNQSISAEILANEVYKKIASDKIFQEFGKGITKHGRSKLFSKKVFAQIKLQIQKISEEYRNKNLVSEMATEMGFEIVEVVAKQEMVNTGKELEKSNSFSTEKNIGIKIGELRLYKVNEYDVGGFTLKGIINNLNIQNKLENTIDNLTDSDFETIYSEIQDRKLKSILAQDDLVFLEKYRNEIAQFKISELKSLENKLFYGYKEIIREMRQKNQQVLDIFKNLKK